MHILWKLKKAFVKEVMAEITASTITTLCRPSCNLEEKDTPITPTENDQSPHHCYRGLQKGVYDGN
jgi:hypothetical protein